MLVGTECPFSHIEIVWASRANNSSTSGPDDLKFDKKPQFAIHHNVQ